MGRLVAVCRGEARHIPGMKSKTGIYKEPVDGPMSIDRQGLVGDAILNRKHHGGVDQAVYVYFKEDYDWWAGELGERPAHGLFGENLVIAGTDSASTAVGDRFGIGSVLLEVTSHRTPCATFAARMGDPRWVKRFQRANRPGAYCRVIEEGVVEAGIAVAFTPYAGERTSVSELMAYEGQKHTDRDFLRRVLAAPVHYKMRADFEQRLATLF